MYFGLTNIVRCLVIQQQLRECSNENDSERRAKQPQRKSVPERITRTTPYADPACMCA